MTGMKDTSMKYNGALDALSSIIRTEGFSGLYRGLWPNLRMFLLLCINTDDDDDPTSLKQLRLHPASPRHFSRTSW